MDIIENIKKRSTELTRKQYMVAKYMIDHPERDGIYYIERV